MKKFRKLIAVVIAIAVVICPMISVVANAEGASTGSYSLIPLDDYRVKLTIHSDDGFMVYKATINSAYIADATFTVDSYDLKKPLKNPLLEIEDKDTEDKHTYPVIGDPNIEGENATFIISSFDAGCIELYTEVVIIIEFAAERATVKLTNIQAADDGKDVAADGTLLDFPAADPQTGEIDDEAEDYPEEAEVVVHVHDLTPHEAKPATCAAEGDNAYWSCECGKFFADENGENEIEENSWIGQIPKTENHTFIDYVSNGNATCTEDGTETATCEICGIATDTRTEADSKRGHDWDYKSNGDGTHSATCKNGCGQTITNEACVDGEDEDTLCDKCNAETQTAPPEPAELPELANASTSKTLLISDKFGIEFKFVLSRVKNFSDYDDAEFEISKKVIGEDYNYTDEIEKKLYKMADVSQPYNPITKLYTFEYRDIAMYEMANELTYTLYLTKDGVRVAYYTFPTLTLASVANDKYNDPKSGQTTKDIVADMLRLGEQARLYFGREGNDITDMPKIDENVNDSDGSKDCSGIESSYSLENPPFTRVQLTLLATPSIQFTFFKSGNALNKVPENMTYTISYYSKALGETVSKVITGNELVEKGTFISFTGSSSFLVDFIALYDSDKEITITVSNGTESWTQLYSLETILANNLGNTGVAGDLYRSIAKFTVSCHAFFTTY